MPVFRTGDNIITQGQEGTVSSIQIFYTVITTFDNKIVIVPNSKLSNEIIINTSREGKRRMDIDGYKIIVNTWVKSHGFQDGKLMLQEKIIQGIKGAGIKLPGMA